MELVAKDGDEVLDVTVWRKGGVWFKNVEVCVGE